MVVGGTNDGHLVAEGEGGRIGRVERDVEEGDRAGGSGVDERDESCVEEKQRDKKGYDLEEGLGGEDEPVVGESYAHSLKAREEMNRSSSRAL